MGLLNFLPLLVCSAIVASSPISDRFPLRVPLSYQRGYQSIPDFKISFPDESFNFLMESEMRSQRGISSRSRTLNQLGDPSRIIFDEDNDEPLIPEPVFERPIRFPKPIIGSPTNQRNDIISNPIQRKPSKSSIRPPPTTPNVKFTSTVRPRPPSKITTAATTISIPTSKPSQKLPTSIKPIDNDKPLTSTVTPIRTTIKSPASTSRPIDSDEILIEGSIYSPFNVNPPFAFRQIHSHRGQYFDNYRTFESRIIV